MSKLKITGKDLRKLGFPENPVISLTMNLFNKDYKFWHKAAAIKLLQEILSEPERFKEDQVLGIIARQLLPESKVVMPETVLRNNGIEFSVFGGQYIAEEALHQMYQAAKLPVSVAGAVMADAHSGYGLPIGGVLATDNAVIPYGVGLDIGCRMCLSIYELNPHELISKEAFFIRELNDATLFGSGSSFKQAPDHAVMEQELFYQLPLLKRLHGKSWKQLGTSGSGNHFVEFGVVTIDQKDEVLNLAPGAYIGLLSHSGSRGLGAAVASHYTKLANSARRLPQAVKHMAWLTLNEEPGMEYWLAMNLAGDYAAACHQVIHQKITRRLGIKPVKTVENHHNFAWKETLQGNEVIVHRKGATPAGKDVLGIIPGSMTADGFIVKGRGEEASINSASHGAGRKLSRRAAIDSITDKQFREALHKNGVTLLGGGLDESPFAYKDIHKVMQAQEGLVDVIGRFTPKIVKMDGAGHRSWKQKRKQDELTG